MLICFGFFFFFSSARCAVLFAARSPGIAGHVSDATVVSCRSDARKQVHPVFLYEQYVSLLFAQIESNMYS